MSIWKWVSLPPNQHKERGGVNTANASDILNTVKNTALQAVESSKPSALCFGTVTSVNPLKIQVEQKLTLGENQLVLTKAVTDHWVDIEVSHYTVNDAFMNPLHTHVVCSVTDQGNLDTTHKHAYNGRKRIMIYNGLLVGERVILLRFQGGQRFVVLDRVCDHTISGEWI